MQIAWTFWQIGLVWVLAPVLIQAWILEKRNWPWTSNVVVLLYATVRMHLVIQTPWRSPFSLHLSKSIYPHYNVSCYGTIVYCEWGIITWMLFNLDKTSLSVQAGCKISLIMVRGATPAMSQTAQRFWIAKVMKTSASVSHVSHQKLLHKIWYHGQSWR